MISLLLAAKEFGIEHLVCVAFRRILEENRQGTFKNLFWNHKLSAKLSWLGVVTCRTITTHRNVRLLIQFIVFFAVQEPSNSDLLALELRDRLTVFQKRATFKRTPVIYINCVSSSSDVQDWLRQKGFDET